MTTTAAIAGMLVALGVGLIARRCLRSSKSGSVIATAIATAIGLTLLQAARLDDLLRIVQPRVAMDWLPLICMLAAIITSVQAGKWRIACGVALAILIPIHLLWGSVYLEAASLTPMTLMSLASWSVALAIPLVLPDSESQQRLGWNTTLWAATTATTAMLIAMSGSLTYGTAAGICGMAIAGVLWSTAQISNLAAVPLICLIGLSAAYSELSMLIAGLLLLTWMGVLIADRVSRWFAVFAIRAAIGTALLLAGSHSVIRFTESQNPGATLRNTVGSASSPPVTLSLDDLTGNRPHSPPAKSEFTNQFAADSSSQSDDPFAGFGTE